MHRQLFPGLVLALFATACGPGEHPAAPEIASPRLSQSGGWTTVFPNVDASFGPIILASCAGGYDLLYHQQGTVTVLETTNAAGDIIRLRFVWNLTITVSNSETGFSLSGPSHGPDQTTFAEDGSSRLVQYGLVGLLRPGTGAPFTIDAGRIVFRIDDSGVTIVDQSGPHPHHEGFPERPVLCALVAH